MEQVEQITSLAEADASLASIAAHKRRIAMSEGILNEEIASLKLRANAGTRRDRLAVKQHEEAIEAFAKSQQATLFTEKQSQKLPFGVLGFRSSRRLNLLPEWTWERTLVALQELDPAELARFGFTYERKEGFFYEIDTHKLTQQ